MSGGMDPAPLFTPEELKAAGAAAEEMRREADAYCKWLRSPEGKSWTDRQIQEATAMVEKLKLECAAGKYALSPSELEQLRRDGVLRKCAGAAAEYCQMRRLQQCERTNAGWAAVCFYRRIYPGTATWGRIRNNGSAS